MIMILLKSLGKRTSIGSYYDEKSLTKCYWDGDKWLFTYVKSHLSPSPLVHPRPCWFPCWSIAIASIK